MEALLVTHLLDTHAVIWMLIDRSRLGKSALECISTATEGDLAIADTTLLEISMLLSKGRISIFEPTESFLGELESKLRVLSIDATIAADAMTLMLPQGDPFDRVIVATARRHGLTLVTCDNAIREGGCVATLW